MLRWQTAGESHGEALVAMIEGLPPASRSPARMWSMRWHVGGWGMGAARA